MFPSVPGSSHRPSVRLAVQTRVPSSRTNVLERTLSLGSAKSIESLGVELLKRVRLMFNTFSPSVASRPRGYPFRINSRLKNSITIQKVTSGSGFVGIRITNYGPDGDRLGYLTNGISKPAKTRGFYAIPVSSEARKKASDGKGPRAAFGNLAFSHAIVGGGKKKKRIPVLVEPTGATFKLGQNGNLVRSDISVSTLEKRYAGIKKSGGNPNQTQFKNGYPSYDSKGRKVHYMLSRGPIRIQKRAGLEMAVKAALPGLSEKFQSGWGN